MFLILTGISNGIISLVVTNTLEDVTYEIRSKISLTNAAWVSEGMVLGLSNATPATVLIGTRTNSLYLSARSYISSDGSGLPSWWEQLYFGTNAVDPFAECPSGDGWTILQAYQKGWNPTNFYTPPPPQNVTAVLDSSGSNAIIRWTSGGGPVTNYVILDSGSNVVGHVSASTFGFTNGVPIQFYGDLYAYAYGAFYVCAQFQNGSQAISQLAPVYKAGLTPAINLVRGTLGQPYLTIASPPPGLTQLYLGWFDTNSASGFATMTVSATNLINGIMPLPPLDGLSGYTVDGVSLTVQCLGSNGSFGEEYDAVLTLASEEVPENTPVPFGFVDARSNVTENLKFLLRSALVEVPFSYASELAISAYALDQYSPDPDLAQSPDLYFARDFACTNASYEYYGFHTFSHSLNYPAMQELRPVQENYLWRNFVFDTTNYGDNGSWVDCDLQWDGPGPNCAQVLTLEGQRYQYSGLETESPLPLGFSNTNPSWLYDGLGSDAVADFESDLSGGMTTDGGGNVILGGNVRNCFGLKLDTVRGDIYPAISPGSAVDTSASRNFSNFELPQLQTVDYYFASLAPYFQFGSPRPPLPGSPDFSVTNTSPLLIAGFGQPYTVAGWAKQQINNGYSGKYAYLEQYFDRADTIGTNGAATTNSAGLLSPYGEFFPTQPGPAALVTLPDIETGQCGTGVVNVIKLQLDVNHDGVMDLSFGGPDNTSQCRPFVFWINNDDDEPGIFSGPDRDLPVPPNSPDYLGPYIHSERDLEDFARLWICGMPLLGASNGYTATLSWTNISSGSPAIKLFPAAETNGGTGYLTDTNIAYAQISAVLPLRITGPGVVFAQITNGAVFTFPGDFFTNNADKHFLFEGAGIGSGELVLSIYQGTNVIAQTGSWLDLRDVKDFYEQAYATNVTSGKPPSSLVSDFGVIQTTKSTAPDETKQIIVFIHGINNTAESYEISSATIFKRLYWSGYHGRFASFRWPCAYLPWNTANPFQYNLGEFYAFKSATALKNYLSYLRNNRPDLASYGIDLYAHSQGNVVASEAILQGAPFDNYILTQGAFPAHCYDTNAPFLQKLLDAETNSVNAVQTPFYPVNGGYHGYCSLIHGNLIDFYNTNDFALATGTTGPLQTNWEEDQRTQKPGAFLGGPSYIYDTNTLITTGYYTFGSSYTVTDLQEIKALVARSRSKAVGAQGGLGGVIGSSVDLGSSAFGFGRTRTEHSAQFDRPIQTVWGYYDEVLLSFGIPLTVNR